MKALKIPLKIPIKIKKTFFKHFPNCSQWKRFFNTLSKKERNLFFIFFLLAIVSGIFLQLNFYFKNTETLPDFGGEYKEGVVGQPQFINPLYLSDNDVDRDLTELIFSGLLKYSEKGEIINDLAQSYEIINNGKEYEFQLKDNLFWHDGEPLTADDVLFSVELAQYPQYKSSLRVEWLGVKTKIEDNKIIFQLQNEYSSFLETVCRLKILPKHIFQDVSIDQLNLPGVLISKEYIIGSGPFKVKKINKDSSGQIEKITLERNKEFYLEKPFLAKISFYFYKKVEDLIKAGRLGEIDGFSISNPKYIDVLEKEGLNLNHLSLPRYFALFFNLKNSKITKEIREVLSYAIDKEEILEKVFLSEGEIVNSPVLPDYYDLLEPELTFEFNIEKAEEILEELGYQKNPETGQREKSVAEITLFKRDLETGSQGEDVTELQKCLANPPAGGSDIYPEGEITGYFGPKTKAAVIRFQEKYASDILTPLGLKNGTGKVGGMTRDKLNEICQQIPKETLSLKFSLVTSDKFPLKEIAEVLKTQFERIGAELEIKETSFSDFQTNILTQRNFELLVFGEALSTLPDPFPFWHSSQKDYPGLNITSYNSKEADDLLEEIRETLDQTERKANLEKFQDILLEDIPAVFLVRGDYFYFLSPKIKGFQTEKIVEPSKRFSNIEKWYIETKRAWLKH